ncbi:MAG: YraN family protein [Bdellovibrionales bacterium]|nr:YraN family protein [Bdellovibrionales bacterium]
MDPSKSKQNKGHFGEARAADWLQRRGFRILQTRWRAPFGRGVGEVDIVALRLGTSPEEIWLCEVKCRGWDGRGLGPQLVSPAQVQRQRRAWHWWRAHTDRRLRIRAALLWVDPKGGQVQFLDFSCYS